MAHLAQNQHEYIHFGRFSMKSLALKSQRKYHFASFFPRFERRNIIYQVSFGHEDVQC